MSNNELPARVRAWSQIIRGLDVPGSSVVGLIQRAELIAERLDRELVETLSQELHTDSDAPEIMHALRQILESAGEGADERPFRRVCSAYQLATLLPWQDEINEGAEVRAQLALIAWRHSRRFRTYRETKYWESRCVAEILSQEHLRDFLALPSSERSDSLALRYFEDGAVLLALCCRFEAERNRHFAWVAREAVAAYETMKRLEAPSIDEERAFFMFSFAMSASNAHRYLGLLRTADEWTAIAKEKLDRVVGQRPYRAIVDLLDLINRTERYDLAALLEPAQEVRQELSSCGVDWHVAAASLLIAALWKDTGNLSEARTEYRRILESPVASGDPLLLGIALQNTVEVNARLNADIDLVEFRRAQAVFESGGATWPIAQLQASVGEFLRDRGKLDDAIEAYRTSIRSYEALSMKSRVAYIRLLLAETLIARGRDLEAVVEITRAVEFSESEGVAANWQAGAALLHEALRRNAASRESDSPSRLRALRQLRGIEKA